MENCPNYREPKTVLGIQNSQLEISTNIGEYVVMAGQNGWWRLTGNGEM